MPITDSSIAPRIKEVDDQLQQLDNNVDRSIRLLDELSKRLARASRPSSTQLGIMDKEIEVVPLASQIRNINAKINSVNLILESTLDCLEM
jgi:hypothetical protein